MLCARQHNSRKVLEPQNKNLYSKTAKKRACILTTFSVKKITPMMAQYEGLKKDYKDCLLFFRLGDFYEMFGDDAKKASKILNIVLTARNKGDHKTPMCGVPYHAAFNYIAKLTRAGEKVAICEQVSDPKEGGLVERKVIKVITPGTTFDDNILDTKTNNYVCAISKYNYDGERGYTISYADITTGEFVSQKMSTKNELISELARILPSECIMNPDLYAEKISEELRSFFPNTYFYKYELFKDPSQILIDHFQTSSLKGFGIENKKSIIQSAGCLLQYLIETQKNSLSHIQKIVYQKGTEHMPLDESTIRNLELFATLKDNSKQGSLYSVIDKTITPMGGRMLKKWLAHPLLNKERIIERHESIEELLGNFNSLQETFKGIHDIERLISKLSMESGNARDLVALKLSLLSVPEIKKIISKYKTPLLKETHDSLNLLPEVTDLIQKAIIDEPPMAIKEGGIIKDKYNCELDDLRKISSEGKTFITNLQKKEMKRTGINSLKVKYNRVFGYYIEISKTNLHLAPDDYIRKQTLVNAERFITPELKEYEDKILNAEEKIMNLEYKLFSEVREKVLSFMNEIQENARNIAVLDVLQSMVQVSIENNYVRPDVGDNKKIIIKNGRHPVIEKIDFANTFIPNDTQLENESNRLLLITGPNMGGKSTYLRQVALIVLLAQIGSFVPAEKAEIGIVDRIFTRVGASDNLIKGESTFMVEMQEAANILNNATEKSLVILDEIGRGTSTYDGVSIAWAITEYLHDTIKAKTLFATHYHELISLVDNLKAARNYSVLVKEKEDGVVFLYKIEEGGVDRSYGIEVAKLAGLPKDVINKSQEILKDLEEEVVEKGIQKTLKDPRKKIAENQINMFSEALERDAKGIKEMKDELGKIDINNLTPIEALQKLDELKQKNFDQ